MTFTNSPVPPYGECAGLSVPRSTSSGPVEHSSGAGGSFFHNPRKHVCECGTGYVNLPHDCYTCGKELRPWGWMNRHMAARAIVKEAE
jgi:hypothetical protein